MEKEFIIEISGPSMNCVDPNSDWSRKLLIYHKVELLSTIILYKVAYFLKKFTMNFKNNTKKKYKILFFCQQCHLHKSNIFLIKKIGLSRVIDRDVKQVDLA